MTLKRFVRNVKKYKGKCLLDDLLELWYDFYIYKAYEHLFVIWPTKLKRALDYFVFGWNNRDFDNFYVDQLVLFKLKRLEYNFVNFGHHSEDCENYPPKMKSLRLAIKLLKLYCNEDKNRMFMDAHDKKWGEADWQSEKVEGSEDKPGGPYYRMLVNRVGAVTEEQKEQERKEFVDAYDKDERRHERLRATAYKIMIKYGHYWWD